MPKPCKVLHNGEELTLRELATATGINPATIFKRWTQGDRGEKLIRPLDKRGIRNGLALKAKPCLVNSLLAGWKLGTETEHLTSSAFAVANTPSARSA
jgi:hypothetical protein